MNIGEVNENVSPGGRQQWAPGAGSPWDDRDRSRLILNHKTAIELLVEQADEIAFNRYTILNLHGLLADNLLADPMAGGRLRSIGVGIDGTVYHSLEVPQLIDECFQKILDIAAAIADPLEQVFFALVHLAYLHLRLQRILSLGDLAQFACQRGCVTTKM